MLWCGLYIVVTLTMSVIGLMHGDWRISCDTTRVCFRKPWSLRIGYAMSSFLVLALMGMFVHDTLANSGLLNAGVLYTWGFVVPGCTPFGILLLRGSGPQDLWINLDTRVCHSLGGWPLFPSHSSCALRETSCLYVFPGSYSYYVVLWIGGAKEPGFTLAQGGTSREVASLARKHAELLNLPIREAKPWKVSKNS